MSQTNAFSNVIDMIVSPGEALRRIRPNPRFGLPLALILGGTVATVLVYYSSVDLPWLFEQQMQFSAEQNAQAAEQAQQFAESMEDVPGLVIGVLYSIVSAGFMLAVLALYALYLKIVSAVAHDGLTYRMSFTLIAWTAIPAVFGFIATLANLILNDVTFMTPDRLNPLSFSNLLALDAASQGVRGQLLSQVGPTNVWGLALLVLGHRLWTQKGLGRSAAIVLAPPVLIYGGAFYLLPASP